MSNAQEIKSFSAIATKILDADQGIVEHIVAVMGNIDRGQDVIHPGAFSKTIGERGLKVKVLDQHDTRSVEAVVGKPLALREISRYELPPDLVLKYPEATGALLAKTQFLLDTQRGREVFNRIKAGAVDEYSIGYDPIQTDFATVETPEGKQTVRNLREVRLWEYSPVVFGMNPATSTLSAKESEPMQSKPWNVFAEDGQFCVYKVDEQGQRMGDSLGCHETRDQAVAQMRALYANEPEAEEDSKAVWSAAFINDLPDSSFLYIEPGKDKDEDGKTVPRSARHFPYKDADGTVDLPHLRNAIARIPQSNAPGLDDAKKNALQERARRLLEDAKAARDALAAHEAGETLPWEQVKADLKAGRVIARRNAERLSRAVAEINEILKDAGLLEVSETDDESVEDKEDEPEPDTKAGPAQPPTSTLAELQVLKLKLETMEVER